MKNKSLTAILALFLPLLSAGQQSLTAFLLTSGPNADPATLVCTLDDVGGIGYVAGTSNGLTVQRVGATVGGITTCEQQTGRLVLRTLVPPTQRFKEEPERTKNISIPDFIVNFANQPDILVICNK